MNERLTPYCPLCSEPPLMVFDEGHQAWCGTHACEVVTWDMYLDLDVLLTTIHALTPVENDRP